jgi:hypothetical protein
MNPYEPILKEIASGLLETAGNKPNFSNDALLDATLIFQTVLFDKVHDLQVDEKMKLKYGLEMAESLGNELRKIIKIYTGLDTHELVNNYGNETD